MRRLNKLLVVAVIVGFAVGPSVVAATEDPRFETTVQEPSVAPGHAESLTVTVLNDADDPDDRVDTATDVEIALERGATPFTVTSGSRHLGSVPDGQPIQTQFAVDVPQNVESGRYSLPVRITYEYDGDERDTTVTDIELRISDRAKFAIVNSTADVLVQSEGTTALTVENVGSETAKNATVQFESRSPVIAIVGSRSGVRSIGEIAPGEQTTVNYAVTTTGDAEPDQYPVLGTVTYDDADGTRQRSSPLAGSIAVKQEQTVSLAVAESDLRVDQDGSVTLSVTNAGPRSIGNANLQLEPTGKSIHPKQTEFALGDLTPGETATATYEFGIDDDATPSPRQLPFQVTYDDANGDRHAVDPRPVPVDVKPQRPMFQVSTAHGTIPAGETGTIALQITNTGDEAVSSVTAKAFTNAPVTITDDSAFVTDLEPGESAVIEFGVAVPPDALSKDYPLSVDFQYREPDGDTRLTDTFDVPVSVTEGSTFRESLTESLGVSGLPTDSLIGGVVGFLIGTLGYGLLVVRRRRR